MYTHQSILDPIFLMLYGAVAMLALVAGIYLWLMRGNGVASEVTPPQDAASLDCRFLYHCSHESRMVVCTRHPLADG